MGARVETVYRTVVEVGRLTVSIVIPSEVPQSGDVMIRLPASDPVSYRAKARSLRS